MATGEFIPVVDFQCYREAGGSGSPAVQELHKALTTVGFVLLTNTGIDPVLVRQLHEAILTLMRQTHLSAAAAPIFS